MAFMYPIHFPSVPLRWDESIWTSILNSEEEEALITNLEARIIARVGFSYFFQFYFGYLFFLSEKFF